MTRDDTTRPISMEVNGGPGEPPKTVLVGLLVFDPEKLVVRFFGQDTTSMGRLVTGGVCNSGFNGVVAVLTPD